jgi:hypothetical protein
VGSVWVSKVVTGIAPAYTSQAQEKERTLDGTRLTGRPRVPDKGEPNRAGIVCQARWSGEIRNPWSIPKWRAFRFPDHRKAKRYELRTDGDFHDTTRR